MTQAPNHQAGHLKYRMYLDLITGSAWCLSGPLKRQDRPSLQSTSQGNMGDSEPPDILYDTCACVIHTSNLQLHVHNIIETLHDQSFSLTSEDSLRDSVTGYPRTKGQES